MRTLILAAVLTSLTVYAQARPNAPGSEEEEEEGTGKNVSPTPEKPGSTPGGTAPATTAPTTTPPSTMTPPASEVQNPDAQKLVSGAPLYNPNVAVHIVEKKQFADQGKRELILIPAAVQANGKFTNHIGAGLGFVYHVQENFGFQVAAQYNWFASESQFNNELINKVREEAQAATSLLLVWGAYGGVEATPLYGKFAWYSNSLAHFAFVLNGGVGIGATKHQLKPANNSGPGGTFSPASYGDTGEKFLGEVGGGFRLQLGDRFAFRAEVRDLVYSARADRVNGCDAVDLKHMDDQLRSGSTNFTGVSAGCDTSKFSGVDSNGRKLSDDVPLAKNLVETPSSDVLNNVNLYLGVSVIF